MGYVMLIADKSQTRTASFAEIIHFIQINKLFDSFKVTVRLFEVQFS
jgi:hypothetical protein